ncbi:hypothetical protein CLV51_101797 [Chitinophaga niastensis]|uniref:Glycosyltransferase involved in cell wall biosynthesis n=1 Tax=Chitinophaga niastensis TaxID=536980 RepID=A0A2P8HTH1_CHINA|nr:hypothetical protein [Chitinophaga niastensis]PSL49464.1 hypothetical protein CLV51_101797 [Chitinophaga niastensis]
MLHIVRIFDATAVGPSVLDTLLTSSWEKGEYLSYKIYIGSNKYVEYTEQEINGEVYIYIPFPYTIKYLANISAPELKKYSIRLADLLEQRFCGKSNLLFHFENANWGYLAQRIKTTLNAIITCGYNGTTITGNTMQLAMITCANSILCTSQVARKQLLVAYPHAIEKVTVIYNVTTRINKTAILPEQRNASKIAWGLQPEETIFVFNKQIAGEQYNMQSLILAFSAFKQEIPQARLFILHEPDIMSYPAFIEKNLWSSITFINGLSEGEVMELYATANAVIMPALTEDNFLYILLLLQRGIRFIYDNAPDDNSWFNELVNMEVVKPLTSNSSSTHYLLHQLKNVLTQNNNAPGKMLPAAFTTAFIQEQLIAVYEKILGASVIG